MATISEAIDQLESDYGTDDAERDGVISNLEAVHETEVAIIDPVFGEVSIETWLL